MTRAFLTLIIAMSSWTALAQSLNDFRRLQSTGEIPDDFIIDSNEKFEVDADANEDKNLDKEFFLNTRFFIDELLQSGKVTFKDPISEYVSKVAAKVLENNFSLYNKLRFYTIKSNVVNAFSTDQGIIFVTTGLVARLQSEAELAFILSHEISHFTEQHVKDGYLERKKVEKSKGGYKELTYDEGLKKFNLYNRDNEFEADLKGYEIFKKSIYSNAGIYGTYDLLARSEHSFTNEKLSIESLTPSSTKLPSKYYDQKKYYLEIDEHFVPSKSTHPSIHDRRERMREVADSADYKKLFFFSEEDFNRVRNFARFEGIRLLNLNQYYVNAFYESKVLLLEMPDNDFLKIELIKSLYGLFCLNQSYRNENLPQYYEWNEGESGVIAYLFTELSQAQTTFLIYRYSLDVYESASEVQEVEFYFRKIQDKYSNSLFFNQEFQEISFDEYQSQKLATIKSEADSSVLGLKMKEETASLENWYTENFHEFLFHDRNLEQEKEEIEFAFEWLGNFEYNPPKENNNIIVVNPLYENYSFDSRRRLVKSDKESKVFTSHFEKDYKNLDLEVTLLAYKNLQKEDVESFNELSIINEWSFEVFNEEFKIQDPFSTYELNHLERKYKTDQFLFAGAFAYKSRIKFGPQHLLYIVTWAFAPVAILDLLVIHNFFNMAAFTISPKENTPSYIHGRNVQIKGSGNALRPYVYELLLSAQRQL